MVSKRNGLEYKDAADCATWVSKHDIDSWASSVAKWCKFKPGASVMEVVGRLGGRIEYDDPSESPEGGTIFIHGPSDFDIVLSTWTSPRRDQFTLAHELGHYFLHSDFGNTPLVAARSGSGRSEWEANWFAAGFLMPADLFRPIVESGGSAASIAEHFGVSASAVDIRMKSLGLAR